ncbi:hypothetical protein [Acrocarpospora sp. B8E8]|uniref:hypothetical protein n=1 Tax=Acrocarpospora sp. B8E8 TaxID=3153572 RepID=UPI00325ED504
MPVWGEDVPSDTAHEVRMALKAPQNRWSEPALLTFPAAVAELTSWLNDARNFDPLHAAALQSAMRDYDHAVNHGMGTHVTATLTVELKTVDARLMPLRRDGSGDKQPARSALQNLADRLLDHRVLQAAWRDLWAKISTRRTSAEAIAVPRDLFLALAQLAGHNLKWGSAFIRILSSALADDAWAVTEMRACLGDPAPPVVGKDESPLAPVGLTLDERKTLCERFLALPATPSQHAVWLAYEKASMPVLFASLGDITFYSSQYVPDEAEAASAKCSSHATNWTRNDGEFLATMPHKIGVVTVRVLLHKGVYADPVSVARVRVEALVAVGRFHAGIDSSYWRLAPGHKHISETHGAEEFIELDAGTVNRPLDHPRQSAVFMQMKAFWQRIDSATSIDDARLAEAVDLLHWWQAAQLQAPLTQVIANVRAIETVASRVGTAKWHEHLSAFLKSAWIVRSIHENLLDTIRHAVGCEPDGLDQQAYKRRQAVAVSTLDKSNFGWIGMIPGTTRAALTELIDIYPERHHVRRRLRALSTRLDNPEAFKRWRAHLDHQWTCLTDRLERIRDSITHGGPATPDAVQSIVFLSSRLSAWEIQLALESALTNVGLEPAHTDFCKEHSDLLDKMCHVVKPGDVIHESALPPRSSS